MVHAQVDDKLEVSRKREVVFVGAWISQLQNNVNYRTPYNWTYVHVMNVLLLCRKRSFNPLPK